jgi:FkbM family methyltransferase
MEGTLIQRFGNFLRKPLPEKKVTARFFLRQGLTRLPYLPVRIRLTIPRQDGICFWWSYIPAVFQPDRTLLDYWGDDTGELRFLWRFLQPGMTFFDVGAYHGLYSILAMLKLRSQGRVVAFEPSARERRRLESNLRLNGLSGLAVEPFAVSAREGTQALFTVLSGFTSMNSLRPPSVQSPVKEVVVETITLDGYLKQKAIERVDLMKLDLEGGEKEAICGAGRLFSSIRPFVICEVLDWVTKPWGYPAREIVSALGDYDYKWFDFRPDGALVPHEPRDEYPEVRNYLAAPREKLQEIAAWIQG